MELEVSDDTQLCVQGSTTVFLPRWMKKLPGPEFDQGRMSNNRGIILAIGCDRKDIVILTGDGQLMKVDHAGIPRRSCIPIDKGRNVLFPQVPASQGGSLIIDATYLVDHAVPLNVRFGGEPIYRDHAEDQTGTPPEGDQGGT